MSEAARPAPPLDALRDRLAGDGFRIGEVLGQQHADGAFRLVHRDDAARTDLVIHSTPDTAPEIARYDDAGNYRPLKTAPNLRHGWLLVLRDIADVRLAIEFLYPGRLAALTAHERGALRSTAFRETLARQTGMYRVTAKISDPQADDLIARVCRSDGGCLRTILWHRDAIGTLPSSKLPSQKYDVAVDQTGRGETTAPLLCQEICNLLVAAARDVVKASE